MIKVNSGLVAVEDGTKPAEDYAPARKVRFELHYELAEGANVDEVLALVGDQASAAVDRLLGRTVARVSAVAEGNAEAPAKRTRKAKEPETVTAPPQTEETGTTTSAPASPPPAADDWDTPIAPSAKPITDAELADATTKKNGELQPKLGDGAPVKIRELIGSFNPDPLKQFRLQEIPAARRQEYLDKLAALA